jgi:hypothetical protein
MLPIYSSVFNIELSELAIIEEHNSPKCPVQTALPDDGIEPFTLVNEGHLANDK